MPIKSTRLFVVLSPDEHAAFHAKCINVGASMSEVARKFVLAFDPASWERPPPKPESTRERIDLAALAIGDTVVSLENPMANYKRAQRIRKKRPGFRISAKQLDDGGVLVKRVG